MSGLFALQYLIDKGVLDKALQPTMYETFLASAFRSIRFGLSEAHGKGIALQLNWLLDDSAFRVNADGTFAVNHARIKDAVTRLTSELMTLQAEGDYGKAVALLKRLAVMRPEVQKALDRLAGIPVDIEPRFESARALLEE